MRQWDDVGALNFVDKIERGELRAVAGFGAAKGILALAKTKDVVPNNGEQNYEIRQHSEQILWSGTRGMVVILAVSNVLLLRQNLQLR
jgi:hypothetical protein